MLSLWSRNRILFKKLDFEKVDLQKNKGLYLQFGLIMRQFKLLTFPPKASGSSTD